MADCQGNVTGLLEYNDGNFLIVDLDDCQFK